MEEMFGGVLLIRNTRKSKNLEHIETESKGHRSFWCPNLSEPLFACSLCPKSWNQMIQQFQNSAQSNTNSLPSWEVHKPSSKGIKTTLKKIFSRKLNPNFFNNLQLNFKLPKITTKLTYYLRVTSPTTKIIF